jgi:hypothetical protein
MPLSNLASGAVRSFSLNGMNNGWYIIGDYFYIQTWSSSDLDYAWRINTITY